MFITKINHEKAENFILTTPKIRYPFDSQMRWHFPKAVTIHCYEKLDGTNIFAYSYKDSNGKVYVSYKTRLTPFLKDSKFGPFKEMWKEILSRYPEIPKVVLRHGINISFELWGSRNPHLVKYNAPLEASALFIRSEGKVEPPIGSLSVLSSMIHFPFASFIREVKKDYVWSYQQAQEESENKLKETEDGYLGSEGEVWYLLDELNNWHLYKCKPHTIENIHWSQGGIGKNIIVATCYNAYENYDNPTVENVVQLLLEEFSQSEVDKIYYGIENNLQNIKEQYEFKQLVLNEYNQLGISILVDKVSVMRALSYKFEKNKMNSVFSIIWSKEVK